MAKATTTIKQSLQYQPQHEAWFAANQHLFNRVAAFYFSVVQAHEKVLELGSQEALTALEKLTHTTERNPHPVMPLSEIRGDIPAMFRRAAIHAALGSAHSFSAHLKKWRERKEQALAKGKTFTQRPPVPPRTWNKSATLDAGMWKERTKRNTSRECARCHAPIIRYASGQPEEGYTAGAPLMLCPVCGLRGNADRNASACIGQRLITRSQQNISQEPSAVSQKKL